MKDNPSTSDYPAYADAGGAYAVLGWVAFALYVGITFALGGHTFKWFLIGVGAAVGLFSVLMMPVVVFLGLRKLRERRERRKFPEVERTGPIPGGGGLTYEKQDAWLREISRQETLRYQFGYLWHHLRHPEQWGLIGNDPDIGSDVWTQASLEASTTEQARSWRSTDRLAMWLVILTVLPCAVAALLFFPMLMISISRGGMSMWWLAGMAYAGTGLIFAGCYVHDRIAIRARRRAQRRAILAKHA